MFAIKQGFVNINKKLFRKTYGAFVRSHLEQLRGDLIQTYRIIRGRECALEFDEFFELARTDHLRYQPFKLQRKPVHMEVRRNAFS
ncbi:unnamed protein product [Dibothriocephalus latus]|uniref:Uncharacterized protein n=1 Tax=Dibothriocephalus latus TaxID=60516 RepID=A0A3P7MWN2_DIBLA|nr:unnamed protein product [Dibothriocephalus latus]